LWQVQDNLKNACKFNEGYLQIIPTLHFVPLTFDLTLEKKFSRGLEKK